MLGSNHEGERAVAGLKASQLLRERGLTWFDVIRPPIAGNADADAGMLAWQRQRQFCLQHTKRLQPKELGFLINISNWRGPLTERQQTWLDSIATRLQREMAA
jgi:hypothetical protein